MTLRKLRLTLAPNIDKEEQWLNEMSRKGLQMEKYQLMTYVFEENRENSYIYQIDFRPDAKKDYFQLYEDAGWEHVTSSMSLFHYFRTDTSNSNVQKLYSDKDSIGDSYKRMLSFYVLIFILFLVSQLSLITTWRGNILQFILLGFDLILVIIYLYMFYAFNKRLNFYRRQIK